VDSHDPTLREVMARLDGMGSTLSAKFDGLREVIDERDEKYTERDRSNKEAVRTALVSVEKMADMTAQALKEYKIASNEWRTTVQDLIAGLREARSEHGGQSLGIHAVWAYIFGAGGLLVALVVLLEFGKKALLP
jgi:Flp pilus assembly protein TadB